MPPKLIRTCTSDWRIAESFGAQPLAQRIDHLRKLRTYADYDLWKTTNAQDASDAAIKADAIIADFQTILRKVPAQQIADGVKNYLVSIGRITT